MTRILPVLFLLAACSPPTYLPDGGRPRQTCMNTHSIISVKAQDQMGVAISDAMVTATNTSTNKTITATTGGDGRTNQIDDNIGDGMIHITATAGSLSTHQPFVVQVLCGECDCTVMPSTALLTLE